MCGLRVHSWLLIAAVWMSLAEMSSAASPVRWKLTHQPVRVVNGAPVLFLVTTPQPVRTLSGKWLGHEISFSSDDGEKAWFALAGASLETRAGKYPIELSAETTAGKTMTYQQRISLQRQRYPKAILKVPGRYTAPSPEELQQIAQDKEIKELTFKTLSAGREWKGSFTRPVDAEISGVFGVQRVFNGTVQSTHQGLDFRARAGTPVAAVNRGRILLARPLFFEGNCVVIDHGQGLLTLYLHLSKFLIKEGDTVEKGQPIALSGDTGRATGPHLHLAVRWQGIYLNPAGLLSLRLP
jgi:murein DD-endopeptidase MepM/ murein hydrolase activator NlpD